MTLLKDAPAACSINTYIIRDLDFSVVCRARSSYNLQVLEAVHIVMPKPVLCVQKSHVLSLHLVNTLVV